MCVFSNAAQMDASLDHQVAWNNRTHQYVPESDNQFFSLYLIQTFFYFKELVIPVCANSLIKNFTSDVMTIDQ